MESNLNTITQLISCIEEGDFDYLSNFISKINDVQFSAAERRRILTIADEYQDTYQKIGVLLVKLALNTLDKELLEDVALAFTNWDKEMRSVGLEYLDEVQIEEAIDLYVELAVKYREALDKLPLSNTINNKHMLLKLLTGITKCIEINELKIDYYKASFAVLDIAPQDFLNVLRDNLIADLIVILNDINKYRHHNNELWFWNNSNYLNIRELACVLLELSGRIGDQNFVSALRSFMRIRDMKIRCNTAISIIRLGGQVRKSDFISIAANPETRNTLYSALEELNLTQNYPEQFMSREYFAESQMVQWLVNNSQLKQVPDEIELHCSFVTQDGGYSYEWYLFKFLSTKEEYKERGHMACIVGPYVKSEENIFKGGNFVYSCFESFESKTPEQHIEQIFEVLKNIAQ